MAFRVDDADVVRELAAWCDVRDGDEPRRPEASRSDRRVGGPARARAQIVLRGAHVRLRGSRAAERDGSGREGRSGSAGPLEDCPDGIHAGLRFCHANALPLAPTRLPTGCLLHQVLRRLPECAYTRFHRTPSAAPPSLRRRVVEGPAGPSRAQARGSFTAGPRPSFSRSSRQLMCDRNVTARRARRILASPARRFA